MSMVFKAWACVSTIFILYTAQIKTEVIQCAFMENCVCQEQGQCDIYCSLKDGCDGQKVTIACYPNYPCNVHCSGESSCKSLHINANESTAVQMICSAKDACKGASTSLTCGTGDCSLNCLHYQSCQNMVVDTHMAHSFECNGVCPLAAVLQQYTQSPTRSPTLAPTALPTLVSSSPTQVPSTHPSLSPTSVPTRSPTKAPTMYPTVGPSVSPSVLPTDFPTAGPTLSTTTTTMHPTTSPSPQPTTTMIPTNSPSLLPTFSPTAAVMESTLQPTNEPTAAPTVLPTIVPAPPTIQPTATLTPTTGAPSVKQTEDDEIVTTSSILVQPSRCRPNCVEDAVQTDGKVTIEVQYWFSHDVRYDLENIECFLHRIFSNFMYDLSLTLNVCDLRVWRVYGGVNETRALCEEAPPCFVKFGDDTAAMNLEYKDGNTSMLLMAQDSATYGKLQALDVEQMSDDFVLAFAISFGLALDVTVSVDNTMVRNQITSKQSDTNANRETNPEKLTTLWIIVIVFGVILVCIGCVGCMFMLRACALNDKLSDALGRDVEDDMKGCDSPTASQPSRSLPLSSPIWQMSNRSQKTHSITSFDVISNPSSAVKLSSKRGIFHKIPSRSADIVDVVDPVGPNPRDLLRGKKEEHEHTECDEEEKHIIVNPIETDDMNNHEMAEGFAPMAVRVDTAEHAPSDPECVDDNDEHALLTSVVATRLRVTSVQMQLMEGTNKRQTVNLRVQESDPESETDSSESDSVDASKLSVSLAV